MTDIKTSKNKTVMLYLDPKGTKLPKHITAPTVKRYINHIRRLFHGYGFHNAADFTDSDVIRAWVQVRQLQWKLFIPPEVALFYVLAGHVEEPK